MTLASGIVKNKQVVLALMTSSEVFDGMSMDRKVCLKWNDFTAKINFTLGELRSNSGFADVTLVCEDGQQIKAHKIILSSLCPFFLDIFRNDFHPHPLIYMMGAESNVLAAIVDLLYKGESTIGQDNLENFLALAKRLRLTDLSKTEDVDIEEGDSRTDASENDALKRRETLEEIAAEIKKVTKEDSVIPLEKVKSEPNEHVNKDRDLELKELDYKISSMIDAVVMIDEVTGGPSAKIYTCKECGKIGTYPKHMRDHIEAHHISGFFHYCDNCGKGVRTRDALKKHRRNYCIGRTEPPKMSTVIVMPEQVNETVKSMIDKGKTLLLSESNKSVTERICKVCGKEGRMVNIMRHVERHHIETGIPNSCDICGKLFNTREALKRHKSNVETPGSHRCGTDSLVCDLVSDSQK